MSRCRVTLELRHVEEVLRQGVLVGSDTAFDGTQKRFVFFPWENEYRVYHGDLAKYAGQAVEELLIEYNGL